MLATPCAPNALRYTRYGLKRYEISNHLGNVTTMLTAQEVAKYSGANRNEKRNKRLDDKVKTGSLYFLLSFFPIISNGQQICEFDFKNGDFKLETVFDSSGKLLRLCAILNSDDITDMLNMAVILSVPHTVDRYEITPATLMRNGILSDYDREFIKSQETSYFLVEVKITKKYRQVYACPEIKFFKEELLKCP